MGCATKPFVLPQEDPLFYDSFLKVYDVPEFTKEPVHIGPQDLANAAFSEKDALTAKLDPNVIQSKNNDKAKSAARVKTP
jgi:hypothetical protein